MDMLHFVEIVRIYFITHFGSYMEWLGWIVVFMGVDILTAIIGAFVTKEIASTPISIGLLKKCAILMTLVAIIPLTFLLPDVFSKTMIIGVYALETFNEFVSIAENIKKLGVNNSYLNTILSYLGKHEEKEKDNDPDRNQDQ